MSNEIPIVNRGCLIVRPNLPYVEWINSLPNMANEPVDFDEVDADFATYLVPEIEDEEDVARAVEAQFEKLFQLELEAWTMDKNLWPEITWSRFCEWFDVDCSSLVLDLAEEPLLHER